MKFGNAHLALLWKRSGLAGHLATLEAFLAKHGLWALLVFAAIYYALYFNAHLTLTGEAGSNVLIAQRINEGWRPIKDMFIGYNLMWFYPLAWIFEFTGPHLLASRIYFMVLSGVTGLLGFALVRRATGSGILAATAGTLMILMPGAMYRNNVAFVATLASFALVYGYVIPHRSRSMQILWMGFAGAAMSLCFLIRIEPSLLASVIWAGLALLYPIGCRGVFLSRLGISLSGTILGLCAFAAVHAPFVHHAYKRGFGPEFIAQYSQFVGLLRWELIREIEKIRHAVEPEKNKFQQSSPAGGPAANSSAAIAPPETRKPQTAESSDGRRPRPPFADSIQKGRISFFPLSIYFPILASVVLVIAGGLFFLRGAVAGLPTPRQSGLAILATTGCALTLFPQFFFFRPDSVHLAEFMVPFYPALACGAAAAIGLVRLGSWRAFFGTLVLGVAGLQAIVAFNSLFGREGSGSIRIARGKTVIFQAPGGIRFRVNPEDLVDWERLRDVLNASTRDGDCLVTYPYVPLLNVMDEWRSTWQGLLVQR
ncbi:MAG: hypothetical protein ACKOAS_06310, partial [Verrucomicrobiota bacterium]